MPHIWDWGTKTWLRVIAHFLVGGFCAWLTVHLPTIGVILSIAFLFYEAIEDWRIFDLSFKDVYGFLWGYGLVGALYLLTRGGPLW